MTQHTTHAAEGGTADLIDRLLQFDGPPEQFLHMLLSIQCRLAPAQAAAILRPAPQGIAVVAAWPAPDQDQPPLWLAQAIDAASRALRNAEPTVLPLRRADEFYDQPAREYLVLLPLRTAGAVRGLAAFLVVDDQPQALDNARRRLELSIILLGMYEMRLTAQQRTADLARLKNGLQILAAVNSHRRFKAAAMALCNEIASRYGADRVGLGFLAGRYVKLRALSHTEKFTRKMKLVQDIESAMEECADQDTEILYPADPDSQFICRAAEALSVRHGPITVCCLPLRYDDRIVGVVSIERPADRPLTLAEVEAARLTCEICTARLADLEEHDRWFGARCAAATRKGLGVLVGPKQTWLKLLAIGVIGLALFLVFVRGMYRVEAPFVIEPTVQRIITAPFAGYLVEAPARPGDAVRAGQTLLAALDVNQLIDQRQEAAMQRQAQLREADIARRDGKHAEAQVATARADAAAARVDLLDHQIARARLIAPIDGVVLTGDWSRQIGRQVEVGDVLYTLAPLDNLRAVLHVSEGQIADVHMGQTGLLASAAHPGRYVRFQVERIDPMAEVVDQKNVFTVRVKLLAPADADRSAAPPKFKPGVEGLAKIDVEPRPYGLIWSRRLINWLRMKLWL